jgi:hypothetical protein
MQTMRKLLAIAAGIFAFGALWKAEAEEDGLGVALSPFAAAIAIAIEVGILLLRQHQAKLFANS